MSPTVPPTSPMHDVVALGRLEDPALDLVGDVRDHLHGAAEVVAAALLADHRRRRPAPVVKLFFWLMRVEQ